MANTKLSQAAAGTVVKINESGSPVEFYIGTQDYESGLNGNGRTLLVRKDCYNTQVWDSDNVNTYATCDIDNWFNTTYKALLDENIQQDMATTQFYYTPGNLNNTVTTLERSVFALSATEFGLSETLANVEGTPLPIASTLQIAYLSGNATQQWTRSPYTNSAGYVWGLDLSGSLRDYDGRYTYGARPCFTLPGADWELTEDGTLVKASSGSDMFIPSTELEQGVEYYFRIFPRNHQNQFQTGIDGSQLHIVVQDGNEAEPDDSVPDEIIPSYTGNSQIFGDGYKGYIEMYDSGVLTFNTDVTVDIFLVGGGGGGSSNGGGNSSRHGGGGGGGGYASQFVNAQFTQNEPLAVTIGAGGAAGTAGGATSVGSYSVNGGNPGSEQAGGAGGSGGGGGGSGVGYSFSGGAGGANGADGTTGGGGQTAGGNYPGGAGGTGQGTSTYEFMDTQLRQFSGGGGGGGGGTRGGGAVGGDGGGGAGGNAGDRDYDTTPTPGVSGSANTGGGGGGSGGADYYSSAAGAGGSGIAIIRWGDWTTTGGAN